MIYIPALWEKPKTNNIITIWASEHKKLEPGKYEWSFGNRHCGYTVLANGRVIRVGLSVREGVAAVALTINGNDTGYQAIKGVVIFETPLEIQQGDVLNLKTVVSSGDRGNVVGGVVSILIELDL